MSDIDQTVEEHYEEDAGAPLQQDGALVDAEEAAEVAEIEEDLDELVKTAAQRD